MNLFDDFDDDDESERLETDAAFSFLKEFVATLNCEHKDTKLLGGCRIMSIKYNSAENVAMILHITVGDKISFSLDGESTGHIFGTIFGKEDLREKWYATRLDVARTAIDKVVTFNNTLEAGDYKEVITSLVTKVNDIIAKVSVQPITDILVARLTERLAAVNEYVERMEEGELELNEKYKEFVESILEATPDAITNDPFIYIDFGEGSPYMPEANLPVEPFSLKYNIYFAVTTIRDLAQVLLA